MARGYVRVAEVLRRPIEPTAQFQPLAFGRMGKFFRRIATFCQQAIGKGQCFSAFEVLDF
jgi:hypothetical protein